MTIHEIHDALSRGVSIYWVDPEPIKDNDYRVTTIVTHNQTATITYNNGESEAEVLLTELTY